MRSANASLTELANRGLRVLYELVSIPSPSGEEGKAVNYLLRVADELGLEAWVDRAGSFYATAPRSQSPVVALVSHVDTVRDWYPARLEGDTVYGRGAVDAKGPLVSMLMSLALVAATEPEAPVMVAGLVGEEADSPGAKYFLRTAPHSIKHIVIGEPTGGTRVAIGYRGSAKIRVVCKGRGGHSASPEPGSSALEKAAKLVLELGSRGRSVTETSFTPVQLVAGDGSNIVPMRAEMLLDTRIPPGKSLDDALRELEELLPSSCEARPVGEYVEPVKVSLNKPVPRALIRAILLAGEKPVPVIKAGTSDMNYLVRLTESIAAYGPGDPGLAHTRDEKLSLSEIKLAIKVYTETIKQLTRY